MSNSTIQSDVPDYLESMDDIADAFGALDDGYDEDDQPIDPRAELEEREEDDLEAAADDDIETEERDGDEEVEDGDDAPAPDGDDDEYEEIEVSDDFVIPVKVNGQDVEVTVADLKRLAGQESAITQKAQALAETRRQVEQADRLARASYDKLLERTNARLKPYEGLDFVQLARNPNITDEQLRGLQEEHRTLMEEKAFLEEGLTHHTASLAEYQTQTLLAKAQENIQVLEDQASPFYVPDFRQRYADLKDHAIKQGADKDFIDNLIDPWTWKLINDSLRLSTTTAKAEQKKAAKVPPVSAKRVKRTRGSNRVETGAAANRSTALRKLRANPRSERAAADAFGALDL